MLISQRDTPMIAPVQTPQPHFDWGQPTTRQVNALKKYLYSGGPMSIYGNDGIADIVKQMIDLNVKIKIPDSTPLHEKKLFTKIESLRLGYDRSFVKESDTFPMVAEYMDERVSLPTFTKGIAQDGKTIDEYIRVFKQFEKQFARP